MKRMLFFLAILIPGVISAQDTKTGDQIEITKAVHEDIYVAGGTVTVNAPISGDLIVGGGTVIINDTVSGDVIAGGGKITVNGYIGDDLRGAGGEVYLNGCVQGDMVVSAGSVTTGRNSLVLGNSLLGTGTAVIGGVMEGSLKCRGGDVKFSGEIKKDADIRGTAIVMNGIVRGKSTLAASKIQIGDHAAFYQDVLFWQDNPVLDFKQAMKEGDTFYEPTLEISQGKWQYLGSASALFMLWYLAAAFILILGIQYFFGRAMGRAADEVFMNTLRSMGYGFLFLILTPVAVLVLMMTLIGIPAGLLLMVVYFMILVLASVISSVVIANWISRRRGVKWGIGRHALVGLLVFVLLKFITLVPVLGWIVMLVICTLAFGGIVTDLYRSRLRKTP